MSLAPRKIRRHSPKRFGTESRIVDAGIVAEGTNNGKRVGDKQIHPEAYRTKSCDFRSRAEKRNADERKLAHL